MKVDSCLEILRIAITASTFLHGRDLGIQAFSHCVGNPVCNLHCWWAGSLQRMGANVGREYWAGISPSSEWGAKILPGGRLQAAANPADRVTFMHWSGIWQARPFEHLIYRCLQSLGILRARRPPMRLWFPYQRLWRYYHKLGPKSNHHRS